MAVITHWEQIINVCDMIMRWDCSNANPSHVHTILTESAAREWVTYHQYDDKTLAMFYKLPEQRKPYEVGMLMAS